VPEILKKFLKISFPILIGSAIIYLFYTQLDQEAIDAFKSHMQNANYWWVFVAIVITMLSHISRAMRWQMMIKSLNYEIGFSKAFYSLFVNYLVNLGIPRTGEIARCAVLKQYDDIPFDKSFGSLVNERVIDVIMLGILGLSVAVFQYDIFLSFIKKYFLPFIEEKGLAENYKPLIGLAFVLLLVLAFVFWLIKNGKFPLQEKFKKLFSGIAEGLTSILNLENPTLFVFHSIFIWLMYWLMTYVIFFAVDGGQDVTIMMSLSILFLGTMAFIVVSGGFGAYPVALGIVLALYGLDPIIGNAAGWLLWGAQTLMIILIGAFSFFMLSLSKK